MLVTEIRKFKFIIISTLELFFYSYSFTKKKFFFLIKKTKETAKNWTFFGSFSSLFPSAPQLDVKDFFCEQIFD